MERNTKTTVVEIEKEWSGSTPTWEVFRGGVKVGRVEQAMAGVFSGWIGDERMSTPKLSFKAAASMVSRQAAKAITR